ncbi:hypothetical protein ACFV7Q_00195 [Streptomyces sp. NPDC059851]|uniref:hypothetical protein n=1 Tax=Streptomyces sp. NPDC059851 TaxID=3346971 RepID=UPI003657E137
MPRPARRARRPRRQAVLAVLLTGTALALSSACSAPERPAAAAAPEGAPASGPAVPVSYGVPQDTTAMVLPASGKDTRLTQGLDGFANLARTEATRVCLAAAHARAPAAPPAMFIRLFEIPDLETVARNGFAAAPVPSPGAAPASAGAAPDAALTDRCGREGAAAAAEVQSVYGPLQSLWLTGLAQLEREESVVAARKGLAACLAGKGVRAADENQFFDHVDRTLQTVDGQEAMRAEDRRLGAVYAACMEPVEAVREPLRTKLRERFAADHQADLAQIRATLPQRIAVVEQRRGIRFSVPAPG